MYDQEHYGHTPCKKTLRPNIPLYSSGMGARVCVSCACRRRAPGLGAAGIHWKQRNCVEDEPIAGLTKQTRGKGRLAQCNEINVNKRQKTVLATERETLHPRPNVIRLLGRPIRNGPE